MPTRNDILREMGIDPVWRLRPTGEALAASAPAPADGRIAVPAERLPTPANAARSADDIAGLDWPALADAVAGCAACGLCRERKQAVLGVGDRATPDWLFIGEGPGAEEDQRGEPFVGQAGRLLDAMLAAMGLTRGQGVYIANAVKCRPPGNRTPTAEEMAACRPYLLRQIALLKPRLIVLMGRAAMHSVLGEDRALTTMRGRLHRFGETPVIVTYHPAYLLRNLPDKAKAWEDLCLALRTLSARPDSGD